jgi:hypothetical protein
MDIRGLLNGATEITRLLGEIEPTDVARVLMPNGVTHTVASFDRDLFRVTTLPCGEMEFEVRRTHDAAQAAEYMAEFRAAVVTWVPATHAAMDHSVNMPQPGVGVIIV